MVLDGFVMVRREDFCRRRALGATRSTIIRLLLAQTAMLAIVGILVGSIAAATVLGVAGDPLPFVRRATDGLIPVCRRQARGPERFAQLPSQPLT